MRIPATLALGLALSACASSPPKYKAYGLSVGTGPACSFYDRGCK